MKILHAADLHLGAPMRAHLPFFEGKLRQGELLGAFLRLLDFAKAENCSAVLLAGDLFDSEACAATLSTAVFSAIGEMPKTDFYYAPGNHEGTAVFSEGIPENLHIFGDDFSCFKKENVVIYGKKSPKGTDFVNIDIHKDDFNILVLHGAWSEGASESAEIPLQLLKDKGIDYCALGHYHSYAQRRIDERGIAVYAGCLEGRGFDETGPKGAVLLEIMHGRAEHRFIPLAKRTLHSIEADISAADDPLALYRICEEALADAKENDLVRLLLTGRRETAEPTDALMLQRHFSGRFYYFEVEDRTVLCPNVSALREEDTVRGEFIRLTEADETLTEEERARILALGLSALGAMGG